MSIKKLNPYLMFNGTADKAIKLYESALGAKADAVMRFGDMPDYKGGAENKDRVMHAMLFIGEGVVMISDEMPGTPASSGANVHVALHLDDAEDMTKKFNALAQGGKVTAPISDTFWGAKFGMLTDAFGIRWMFNCELKKA
jgi:PhnB protein